MKPPARIPAQLSESLHRQLNMYALAAGAAGVGILALPQPADARIVYTPTHQVIRFGHPYLLDVNHDGTSDFSMAVHTCQNSTICPSRALEILPAKGAGSHNLIAAYGFSTYGFSLAEALKGGSKIPGKGFSFYGGAMLAGSRFRVVYKGNWFNVRDHYLGLSFLINGKKHYGWARMNVRTTKHPFTVTGTLTGYAYETIPNKPIIAGKTHGEDEATLGRLAQGASGVSNGRKP
jgi:hypothetical protein